MYEHEVKKIFATHKADIPDDGFSERVIRQLPNRKNLLPQMVMIVSIAVGLVLVVATPGFAPFVLEQISSLTVSISQLQVPSAGAMATYLYLLSLLGIIGYSVTQVEAV